MKRLLHYARRIARSIVGRPQSNRLGQGEIGLIDVGSVGGVFPPWHSHQNKLACLLNFDPNVPPRFTQHERTIGTALWEVETELPFHIYKGFNATGSSLFEQNIAYVDEHWEELRSTGPAELAETWHERSKLVRTTTLRCRRLDDVIAEQNGQEFHFLKIDAQGAEANILRGAHSFLESQCVGLHLELFRIPLYKGIMLKPDVVSLLDEYGFEIVREMPPHGTFDSQTDCVFLHRKRGSTSIRDSIRSVYGI